MDWHRPAQTGAGPSKLGRDRCRGEIARNAVFSSNYLLRIIVMISLIILKKILFYLNTGALIKHDRIGKEFIMNEWLIMNRISNSILSFFFNGKVQLKFLFKFVNCNYGNQITEWSHLLIYVEIQPFSWGGNALFN